MTWAWFTTEHVVVAAAGLLTGINLVQAVRLRLAERRVKACLVVLQQVARFTLWRSEYPVWRAWAGSMGVVSLAVRWRGFDVEFDPTVTRPSDLDDSLEVTGGRRHGGA